MAMQEKQIIGWREWVHLPALNITKIKAKIDTGARTSALHAFEVSEYEKEGVRRVRFAVHPIQDDQQTVVECDEVVMDQRIVMDSGGHQEQRYIIKTLFQLGQRQWPIEMTLTNRDTMKFRMLLGRTAMRGKVMVDPSKSYLSKPES